LDKKIGEMKENIAIRTRILNDTPIDVFPSDIASLKPKTWLTGSIINYISSFLIDEKTKNSPNLNIQIMKTTFFNYNSKKVQDNQLKEIQLILSSSPDYVLVPMNWKNNHWFICVLDMKNKVIKYFDSLRNSDRFTKAQWFFEQFPELRGFKFMEEKVWEQRDGHSCGLFVIGLMKEFVKSGKLTFDSKNEQDIKLKRQEIVEIILNEKEQTRKNHGIQNFIKIRNQKRGAQTIEIDDEDEKDENQQTKHESRHRMPLPEKG